MIYPHFFVQIQLTRTFCCKNDLSTLVLLQKRFKHTFLLQKLFIHFFLSQKEFMHTFFVTKTIYVFFCCENNLRTFFLSRKEFMRFFVAKTINTHFFCRKNNTRAFFVPKMLFALRPESFCALKVAIWKVQTFWASAGALPRPQRMVPG